MFVAPPKCDWNITPKLFVNMKEIFRTLRNRERIILVKTAVIILSRVKEVSLDICFMRKIFRCLVYYEFIH